MTDEQVEAVTMAVCEAADHLHISQARIIARAAIAAYEATGDRMLFSEKTLRSNSQLAIKYLRGYELDAVAAGRNPGEIRAAIDMFADEIERMRDALSAIIAIDWHKVATGDGKAYALQMQDIAAKALGGTKSGTHATVSDEKMTKYDWASRSWLKYLQLP